MLLPRLYYVGLLFGSRLVSGTHTALACGELVSALPNNVFYPEAPTYNATITSYPFLQSRLHPSCVVRPKSSHDVSIAVSVLKSGNQTQFAIKGGGHNPSVGFNNIQDGVTIDMQSLNGVEIARGNEVIRVGAGALWQNVYDVAETRNLTVLGGRIGVVGVPGFLTGGGISFFSPERGWACDGVVNFEIVLASGEIINANATSHSDLFAALKGGQNNFGVITRFDLKAFVAGPIWGGRVIYGPNATVPLLSAYTNMKLGTYDPYAAGWLTVRYNHTAATFTPISILYYTQPQSKPGALKQVIDTQPQITNGMIEAPISEHTRNASRNVIANPQRTVWATTSFKITPTIVLRIHEVWKKHVPEVTKQYAYANPIAELTFQALPAPPRNGSSPNSFGFASTETPEKDMLFVQSVFTYGDAAADEGFQEALKDFMKLFEDVLREESVLHRFKYLNFAASFQDPFASFGSDEVSKLKAVAKKYDPKGVFQKQVPGGFKLF
ncbi:FAD-binding domain-containing protein [Plenodomus tracheiphilus IPT5]|uniref:FAD-binding domain-containing protein n=1 Tax=Plenodomus tracheiphilus IPT5 TaxID=1408161 RepID=A0A6A7ANA8_9PLEO|nr:FAD-binding domain-containing protein [Plenodomus tracheiphilus IPT5]